ncbi:MAG: tail fiber domain-containing protein [Saprospiraceae bacterium]
MLKRILLFASFLFAALGIFAQNVPQGFNYQCIVRDASGNPMANQSATLLFTLRTGAPNGPVVYSEKYTTPTNDYGLVNLVVGQGTPLQGTFSNINWAAAAHYLSVSIETAPNVFDELGASQLMSVPYALFAQSSANSGGDDWGTQTVQTAPALTGNGTAGSPLQLAQQGALAGQVLKWDGQKWIPQDDISGSGSAGGTVTQINTGTGLQGGPITTSGAISLTNTGVVPGQYGNANLIPVVTVDAQGRISSISVETVNGGGSATSITGGTGIGVQQNGSAFTITNLGDVDPLNDLTINSTAGGDLSGAFNNLQIAPNTITAAEIADNSVGSTELVDGSVSNIKLADNAVGSSKIIDGAVGTPDLANNAVTTAIIADNAVNSAKISTGAVGTTQLANGSVTAEKIADIGAAAGQVLKWNGSLWAPANDLTGGVSSSTTITAGPGISVGGVAPNFTVTNTGDLNPNDDLTSGSQANGDMQGTFVTLQIKPGVVTDVEIANSAVRNIHIENSTITGAKLDDMGAVSGQVLKWNGSTWLPGTDLSAGIDILAGQGIDVVANGSIFTVINTGDPNEFDDITINSVAGGDVSGMYDDLQLRPFAVGNLELANNAVANTNIQNGTITANKFNNMGATVGQILKWNGSAWGPATDGGDNWGAQSVIAGPAFSGNGTNSTPLNLAQQGATNGQILKWNGSAWTPSNDLGDNWGTQTTQTNATLTGAGTAGSPLGIAQQGATNGQIIKWNGSAWTPAADLGDNWGTQTAQTNATLTGAGTAGSPLGIAQQGATNGQILKWNGATWTPVDDAGDNWGAQTVQTAVSLSGNGTAGSPLAIASQGATPGHVLRWNGTNWIPTDDSDDWNTDGLGNLLNENTGNVGIGGANAGPAKFKILHGAGGLQLEHKSTGDDWELWVDSVSGNLVMFFNDVAVGDFAPDGVYTASDRRLKTSINSMNSVLDKVLQLEPVTYRYKQNPNAPKASMGLIAQDVQAVFPELVSHSNGRNGKGEHFSVNYAALSVLAVKAIQEQQEQIKELQSQNQKLNERLLSVEERVEKLEKR